jgi:hypothetical protein
MPDMGLFPDEFPFNTRAAEPVAAPAAPAAELPLVHIGPIIDEPPVAQAAPTRPMPDVDMSEAATAEDLAALAEPPPAPAPTPAEMKDRRRSPRQRLAARATLRVDHTGGNPLPIEIDNVSLLGIRFRADRQLLIGDKANLRLEVGPLKWATRLRVINCIELNSRAYVVGCEFVGNELARPYTVAA